MLVSTTITTQMRTTAAVRETAVTEMEQHAPMIISNQERVVDYSFFSHDNVTELNTQLE